MIPILNDSPDSRRIDLSIMPTDLLVTIAGALIAAAIGCATVILCIFALLLAALVAAVAALVGAFVGGQIGKAAGTDDSPTATTGDTLAIGHLVTVRGNMRRREYDEGANVLWWASSAQLHGDSGSPRPFSYCEIDEELAVDGCVRAPVVERLPVEDEVPDVPH